MLSKLKIQQSDKYQQVIKIYQFEKVLTGSGGLISPSCQNF